MIVSSVLFVLLSFSWKHASAFQCELLTCSACPACDEAHTLCAENPLTLPPKSEFWPPEEILQRPYGPGPNLPADHDAELEWFQATVLEKYPASTPQQSSTFSLTETEMKLIKMSLEEWQVARSEDVYSCEEMATALTKRAQYLQRVQKMNHFMYWDSFDWVSVVLDQAKDFDAKAASQGTDALAPLYCYPIPLKGTMATKQFPSSIGFAMLQDRFAVEDAELVKLIINANGVLFGKTNVPELAHSWGTGNYANGLCFNPWDYDMMTGGSSGGSGGAVASFTAAIAITEDTSGSTNTPAVRNHLFGYDPPKFHYPNGGNPSLTYRNDQLGTNARSIEDIIAFDKAVLGTMDAHKMAEEYVAGLSNEEIVLGCSSVYYAYEDMSDAIRTKYQEVESILKDAGYSFVGDCQVSNPMEAVPAPENFSRSAVWFEELQNFMITMLGDSKTSPWTVLLNGYYDFGRTLSAGWMYDNEQSGCGLVDLNSEEAREQFLGPIPAARSDVYNEYFDKNKVDLMMGPGQICDKVLWTEDMGANGGCDGGRFPGGCMFNCHTAGVLGTLDKSFTKAKFIVPVGLTEVGEHFAIQFMSRAGPRNPQVMASEWVFDEEGPKTWNLEELYMVKRISTSLAEGGMGRVDAPSNAANLSMVDDSSTNRKLFQIGIPVAIVAVIGLALACCVMSRNEDEEPKTVTVGSEPDMKKDTLHSDTMKTDTPKNDTPSVTMNNDDDYEDEF